MRNRAASRTTNTSVTSASARGFPTSRVIAAAISDFRAKSLGLKLAHDRNSMPQPEISPSRLRRPRPRHSRLYLTFTRTLKFPQNFARRRIYRHDLPRRDL